MHQCVFPALLKRNQRLEGSEICLCILELKKVPQHTHFGSEKQKQLLMPNYFSVLPSHFLFNQDSLGEDSLNLHHFMKMSENIVETCGISSAQFLQRKVEKQFHFKHIT